MTSSTTITSPPQKLNIQDQPVNQYLPSSNGDKNTKTKFVQEVTKTMEEENTRKVEEGKGSVKDGNLLPPEASLRRIRSVLHGHEDLIPFHGLKPLLKTSLEGFASPPKKVLGKRNRVHEDEENKNELVQKNFMALPLPLSHLILYPAHVHAPKVIEEEDEDDDGGIEDNNNQENGIQENENNGDDGNQVNENNGDDGNQVNEDNGDDGNQDQDENGDDEDEDEEDQDEEEDEEDEEVENEEDQDDEEDEEDENEVDRDEDEDEEVDEEVMYNFLMNVSERMSDDWERCQQFMRYFHNFGLGQMTLRQLRSFVEDAIGNFEDLMEEFRSALVHYCGEDYENIEDDQENEEEDENDEESDDQV